ncbi:MAG: hypothetical protein MK169_00550 [Candidatus Thalassarchaeum sp.]|nr:hypothetical protein [Candidatus Thalassarchaeum sp.]MCS5531390.1 hypothetical protein [Candidatus Poseidoniales archaeon]MEC8938663.1 hypothetical protein [Candidatus Thermoplasmatota archaeon]MEC8955535.1 hypothetical protein [Candidatus Thermoplasmatota archaeon]MEC9350642.1 hypothetical protein [Candidatus Thermoplasmatota archaeon]
MGFLSSKQSLSDTVDDVINNPAFEMLGGYHIFLRRMLIPIILLLFALLVWTITNHKLLTALLTGLAAGPVFNLDRAIAEWLRRRDKL